MKSGQGGSRRLVVDKVDVTTVITVVSQAHSTQWLLSFLERDFYTV